MSEPWTCRMCPAEPRWRLERRGDAVVSWACNDHLAVVASGLQRDWEITELVVTDSVKRREWIDIAETLDGIGGAP
jgi:hypothetical protein